MDNNEFPPPNQLYAESPRHHPMDGEILVCPPASASIFTPSQHGSVPMFSFPALQQISNPYPPPPQTLSQYPRPEWVESKPQSIEDLHAQRTYLLSTLQRENTKAQSILNKIPPLETLLSSPSSPSNPNPPQLTRKTRKRISWLRHRLNETNNQEAAILKRLNQLTTEIQAIEYRERVEMEREHYEQLHESALKAVEALPMGLTPTVRGPGAFEKLRVTTPMLDPKSPCFEPKGFGYPFPLVASPPSASLKDKTGKVNEEFSFSKIATRKDSDDEGPSPTMRTPNDLVEKESRKVRPGLVRRSSSLDSANCNKLLTNEQTIFKRQRSLPTIPGLSDIWKLTSEDKQKQDSREEG